MSRQNRPQSGNGKKKNCKGRRPSKDKNLESNMREEEVVRSRTNDPAWYAQTPELAQLAANIPFSQAAGTKFNLDFWNDETGANQMISPDWSIPGIMTMSVIPTPVMGGSPTSPLNIAATSVYSYVRHANSGAANYDSPDLMIYMLAMSNVYSYINFLQRVYGCMNLYANMNRYLPRAIIRCQRVDYESILNNLPNFKYGIDALIHKASSLACPAGMTYFQRQAFLFSGIYAEGESIKDQLYMFIPEGFMQFSETAETTGGSLQYMPFTTPSNNGLFTYSALLKYGSDLLDPIIASQDMNIMSGDILKAYGDAGILKLALLPDTYMISPTTDLNVLEQFQNAQMTSVTPKTLKVVQSQTGRQAYLVTNAAFDYSANKIGVLHGYKPLTTILTNPGPGDVLERTRLMLLVTGGVGEDMTIESCTEIPVSCNMWFIDPTTGELNYTGVPVVYGITDSSGPSNMQSALDMHCRLENFKFHPAVYYTRATTNGYRVYNMALDIDNFAIITPSDLSRMNEAALLSMFNVNSVAKAY